MTSDDVLPHTIASNTSPLPEHAYRRNETSKPHIKHLSQQCAEDEDLVNTLTSLVNRVYHEAHGSIFVDGFVRTNTTELRAFIQVGEIAAAFVSPRVELGSLQNHRDSPVPIGVIRIQKLSPSLGEFGMLALDASHRGGGFGTDMVRFAEQHCQKLGMQMMQTEALVPSYSDYSFKDRLQSWYQRMGYRLVRVDDYANHYPHLAKQLQGPAEYRVYEKSLG